MAGVQNRSVALLSIRPEYAELIEAGTKRVEFRRSKFSRPLTHVIVYATSPEKRVIGYFEVLGVDEGSPTSLWREHKEYGGISRRKLFKYLRGARQAIAIRIGTFHPARTHVRLEDVGAAAPPQSFRYIDHISLACLEGQVREVVPQPPLADGGGDDVDLGLGQLIDHDIVIVAAREPAERRD